MSNILLLFNACFFFSLSRCGKQRVGLQVAGAPARAGMANISWTELGAALCGQEGGREITLVMVWVVAVH